jgi:hypothetical protein
LNFSSKKEILFLNSIPVITPTTNPSKTFSLATSCPTAYFGRGILCFVKFSELDVLFFIRGILTCVIYFFIYHPPDYIDYQHNIAM